MGNSSGLDSSFVGFRVFGVGFVYQESMRWMTFYQRL